MSSSIDKFASAAFAAASTIKVTTGGNIQAAALTCAAALRAVSVDDWRAYEVARDELQAILAKTDADLDVADKAAAS